MKTWSLKWRLVRNLVALQVAACVLVLTGFLSIYWATGQWVDESGETTAATIGNALEYSPEGQLKLADSKELRWLLNAAPNLWFIARDDNGLELRQGQVPTRYIEAIQVLDGTERAALDLATADARPAARFERIKTARGSVNLIVQTGAPYSLKDKFKRWFVVFLILVAPTVLITSLVVAIATPFVIRRGLEGVVAVAEQAENVRIDTPDTRLATSGVPAEILPLVHAVNSAFDRLDGSYRRQSRFLADAAHELRTPITTLRIQAETLPEGAHKAPLVRATTRLMTLAEQLLDLQRLEHSNAVLQPIDLKELCEKVVADMAPLALMSDCTLAVEAPDSVVIEGDAPSLERALGNLVQNAIKHGSQEGKGGEIEIVLTKPASITVNDSGPGIPVEQRSRVVEPFYRLKARGEGAGLGLHLVAEVLQLHGGRLSIGESPTGGASMRMGFIARKANHLKQPSHIAPSSRSRLTRSPSIFVFAGLEATDFPDQARQ